MIIIQKHLEFYFNILEVPAVHNNGEVTDYTEVNVTDSFNLKEKLTGQTGDNGTKNVEIIKISMKFLDNSWNAFN